MDLLEYQAKELFRRMGIPVLPSQQINYPKDLKGLKIPYPVVLKSQVYTGGRGKAGGIRFVENTIDAVAAAQTIFHLPIMGQYPDVVLAEAKYESDRELYLAVVLDQSSRRPILLGSQEGGIEVESVIANMQRVIVDQEFSPFYARRLALKMGLKGELIQSVSLIVEKMYQLFIQKDLDLVEINPLAVSPGGELMALDGKVTVNDDALGRHPDLATLKPLTLAQGTKAAIAPSKFALVELDGAIAILCNGMGLTMTTVDLVNRAGGKPACFLNVGAEYRYDLPTYSLPARIGEGLELVIQQKSVQVVLINLLLNATAGADIAASVADFVKHTFGKSIPAIVVHLTSQAPETARDILAAADISLFDNLDAAIAHAIALSKTHNA